MAKAVIAVFTLSILLLSGNGNSFLSANVTTSDSELEFSQELKTLHARDAIVNALAASQLAEGGSIVPLSVSTQFPERQIPVIVIAKPQKASFLSGEPILINVEIKNGLNQEIRITAWSFAPNDWNGEVLGVEIPDLYRIPKMVQIWRKRPTLNGPVGPVRLAAPGWYPIPAGKSKTKTIDAKKWEIVDGWIPGKYEMNFRVENIDVDSHIKMSVTSDPITIEVR